MGPSRPPIRLAQNYNLKAPTASLRITAPSRLSPGGRSDYAMTLRRMTRLRVGCALHTASTAPGPIHPAPRQRHTRAAAFLRLMDLGSLFLVGREGMNLRLPRRDGSLGFVVLERCAGACMEVGPTWPGAG